MPKKSSPNGNEPLIRLRGVRQHNLKNIDLDLPLNKLIAVSGLSGSGKSSLALHTLYAEGQRRYVETFSPYARQFLERMDPPEADLIEGIPPGIAIESGTAVRSSRSTVGTITEINDHLKLLYARLAVLHCPECDRPVARDTPESVYRSLRELPDRSRVLIAFPFLPDNSGDWVRSLVASGFLRLYVGGRAVELEEIGDAASEYGRGEVLVVVDRLSWGSTVRERVADSLATAFQAGNGHAAVVVLPDTVKRFSSDLSCADCNPGLSFSPPTPNLFSFNSPLGACPECRGFGRTIGVDLDLVIPNRRLTLRRGAIKPFGTDRTETEDLMRFCAGQGIPVDVPFEDLDEKDREKIIDGTKDYYGVKGFFEWLEGKTYKMHVRVFLSRYRAYTRCRSCAGTRYRPETLLYRLRGATLGALSAWSIEKCAEFFSGDWPELARDPAAELLVKEIRSRLEFLRAVGLEYLSLDRQSRTLSGGEVQRVHLTRALGSAMVNVLYVLDEPSVGLHAKDQKRLMGQLRRLVDIGNTVVVVEHDPGMIRFCDLVVDMGPEGGEKGGEIVYRGTPEGMKREKRSLTGGYLSGRLEVGSELRRRRRPENGRSLVLRGARENNLKNVTVEFPLGTLVGVSGVSGSGKSTLVEKSLYYNWLRKMGRATEAPGALDAMEGAEWIEEAVLVDQQPIGRTPRANLLTYSRAIDPIRKLLAQTPEAVARGYPASHFSFNVPGGRCEVCKGEGFERVEMQFLADVLIRCPQCNGLRFKDEILEVRARGLSIGDMLEATAQELMDRFADHEPLVKSLQPIHDIGLGYLRLGQPLSTLSGGEAQRLKLVHFLAAGRPSSNGRHKLFILDEPTTGLHPHDLQKLVVVLRRLVDLGHSVLVVEHNLDFLKSCDWLIDLGPGGGEHGGEVVATGPPEVVAAHPESCTGRFLREKLEGAPGARAEAAPFDPGEDGASGSPSREIVIRGAREHNLQVDEIRLPRNEMIVLTGLSGSGKSSLAFDVLFAEGQRRYLECLSAYVRQYFKIMEKPDVEQILGLPPTIAIEQRTSRLNRRSTVATITEIYHFLRLLYSKLGRQHCPDCGRELASLTYDQILSMVEAEARKGNNLLLAPLIRGRKGIYRDLFMRLRKMGFEKVRVDGQWMPLDPVPEIARHREHDIEVLVSAAGTKKGPRATLAERVRQALSLGAGTLHLEGNESRVYSQRLYCPACEKGLAPLDPRLFSFNSRHGACPSCTGLGTVRQFSVERLLGPPDVPLEDGLLGFLRSHVWPKGLKSEGRKVERFWIDRLGIDPGRPSGELPEDAREAMLYGRGRGAPGLLAVLERVTEEDSAWSSLEPFHDDVVCPECGGRRLNRQARSVAVQGLGIGDLTSLAISDFLRKWKRFRFDPKDRPIVAPISREVAERVSFLQKVGLDYLALDRAGDTLSGGETQRIRLAAQLGSNLRGVCYVLDEPTIGLHPVDNGRLLQSLARLKEKGNTILVVEHDADTMRQADTLVELGPEAGRGGGRLTAQGSFEALCGDARTLTGAWFSRSLDDLYVASDRKTPGESGWLEIKGASARNLKKIDVRVPLGVLTVVTGVSGAGKSTLVHEVVYRGLRERLGGGYKVRAPAELDSMSGHDAVQRVLEVDHNPIGRTPRSTPATYVGIWDEIRKIFAMLPESRARGFNPGRFSYNVKGGRCESCKGQGEIRVEMSFLPDVSVPCETCGGSRFNTETLAARYKGKSIADVLKMTIDEAAELFDAYPRVAKPLRVLTDLGLGYLAIGQSSPTLSGGEAQRIKLASELGNNRTHTLYVLDEPTTGLHRADVKKLVDVLRALSAHGHTLLVIEHNMDFVWAADYVIDIGPGSGANGGRVVAQGAPVELLGRVERSATARALADHYGIEGKGCAQKEALRGRRGTGQSAGAKGYG
ncbi:MAG TPA: excinuclease ABC subunit UvrA [Syntrophobacter fumaroxidans]|nr:excinuclease ABC subunit UvrA [Syntrophobacter fumaroxidans]